MRNLLFFLLVLVGWGKAYAQGFPATFQDCTLTGNDFINYTPTLTVSPDLPLYSELGSAVILRMSFVCEGFKKFQTQFEGNPPWINGSIIPTNIVGLGVKLAFSGQVYATESGHESDLDDCTNGEWNNNNYPMCTYIDVAEAQTRVEITLTATLVKINDNLTEVPLTPILLSSGMFTLVGEDSVKVPFDFSQSSIMQAAVNVIEPTCTLSQHNYQIPLPPINTTQLGNGVDSAGEKAFSINLSQCQPNTAIYATFHDLNSGGNAALGILGNTGSAKGVGIQLLGELDGQSDEYQPLMLNEPILLTHAPSDGGDVNLPFAARYYLLNSTDLVAGTVNSVASFTLSYD